MQTVSNQGKMQIGQRCIRAHHVTTNFHHLGKGTIALLGNLTWSELLEPEGSPKKALQSPPPQSRRRKTSRHR